MVAPVADRDRERRPTWILVGLAVVLAGWHAWSFHFEIDDAYISFRYAQNLLAGHGLVFNPGDPVEGYSNLLWVLLSAVGMAAGVDALLWSRILGLLATAGLLCLLPGTLRRLDPEAAWLGGAAALLTAACGPVACWTLAGLETPLFALLAVLAWRAALDRRPLVAGLVGLLLCLTRPDGLILGPAFLAWSLLPAADRPRPHPWRRWSGPVLFCAGLAIHFLWRHDIYGQWLPNTYFAKTGDLAGQLRTGLPYGLDFVLRFLSPWLLVAVWATLGLRRAAWRGLDLRLSLLGCATWIAYTVAVGGDMLGMFRFYVVILPPVAICGLVLLGRLRVGRILAACAVAVCALVWLAPSLSGTLGGRERRLITAHMSEMNLGGWKLAGDYLAETLPPGTTLALGPAGYIPYRTGFVSYDLMGITDAHIAHLDMPFTQGYAGHEKHDGAYILSRRPDLLLMSNVDITRTPRNGALIPPFERELDIYQNPDLPRHYEQISIPLPGGRYLNCFRRKIPTTSG